MAANMNDGEIREDVAGNATVFQGMGKSAVFIKEKEIFVDSKMLIRTM